MTELAEAVEQVLQTQIASEKPLAIIVAGHNGSGKSTMWTERLESRDTIRNDLFVEVGGFMCGVPGFPGFSGGFFSVSEAA